jgi:SAM-dependent methyltransferase
MQERHVQRDRYFKEQAYTTHKYIIPFVGVDFVNTYVQQVLEVGCGEGGGLLPFLDKGITVTGVELGGNKVENARKFLTDHPNVDKLSLVCDNIFNFSTPSKFDLIIVRDVVEHIHPQQPFIAFLQNLLTEKGRLFFAFPPWQNPFGGHQQICKGKILSHLPFFHLLPANLYKKVLQWGGESARTIDDLLEIKQTGVTIERFQKIVKESSFCIVKEAYYFINPNYEIKFGMKPREAFRCLSSIPGLRNYVVTSYYCVLVKQKDEVR